MTSSARGRRRHRRLAAGVLAAAALALPALPAGATTGPVGGERLAGTGLVVDAPEAEPLPKVGGAAWLLADLTSGDVLAAQDPHGRHRPASTLKILTALTVLPELQPDDTYVAEWEDANAEGSKVGLVPDASYTVHNLFEALFLVSGNDAARALANAAGDVRSTVAQMNEVAAGLGARDTTAVNPSGLDAPGQFTSAYDLAVIARAAMARDDFRSYARTVKSQFPGKMPRAGKTRKTYEIYTQDKLLLNYRGAIGIKTGWTTKARGTFVGAATRGGRTLVATVLRTEGDGWRDAAALLSWGFRNADAARPVGTLEATAKAEAAGGPAPQEAEPAGTARVAATAGGSTAGMPWWAQVPVVLLAVVVVLRMRVLLLRQARRRRAVLAQRAGGGPPQPRDRRRATSVAASAPAAAPSAVRRHPPPRPVREATDPTSSASTGTAS